ncbi:MAG: hypothetical protein Q8N77_02445 [Nanoarchaeota archaeon]|nr:hypothetical protein [Nanoarchaeota archaeon]
MKNGQVTAFVIIGIVLAAVITLSFIFKESIAEQASKIGLKQIMMSKEAKKVQSDMQACIGDIAELGLITMGLQGGYSTIDSRVMHTETQTKINYIPYDGTAYSYFKGQNLVPTKEIMEKQLAYFVTSNIDTCENPYEDMEVSYGKTTAMATLQKEKISLNVNTEVKIKKGTAESGFKSITLNMPVRLGTVQEVANEIVTKQIKISEEDICVSCVARIAAENDVGVEIDKIGEDVFYLITDEKSRIADTNFMFVLANKF